MTQSRSPPDRPADLVYEDLSRLNNELVTLQRRLSQRNADLVAFNAELESRVTERTRHLEQSNEELETLAYAMAHDLRAPARHVEAFAGLLEDSSCDLPPREREWLRMMCASARRQSALIEDILGYLRLGSSHFLRERIDMELEVRDVAGELMRKQPRKDVEWSIGELAPASGDRALVRAILRNLLANALKFSAGASPPRLQVRSRSERGEVVYSVCDNGVGFDPARVAKMFRPFERFHCEAQFPGLGIGLAIVKRLVTRHDGRAWAESAPARGATFHFTLASR